ncbi:efflux RND transporter periplasmic adaptor subunit [Sinomicrobium weinanense]|uniref:Efflux RND transporter periplasmic adaptor subunit n=1 Tax=Sinomicrobium weinanense TaxID=2842200 RepID=A0A926Q1X9_9FLAO|nr:efflux RND transporter periplasmic adaptor subunit [Sinomicrobium weinanense]MBC9795249.1 efflux RND transporter periplasmic adaptor subunit [Sinomicrobium weinanense]MBU3125721.1 efflux RND transporter periplasmic adaptor subunit [Sinomicrobium weinanense]
MSNVFKFLTVTIVMIMIALTGMFLYSKSTSEKENYTVVSPFVTDIVDKVVVSGTIVPRNKVEVKPDISGIVEEILVKPGDKVKKGDLLARITIVPNLSQLSEADGDLEQARIDFASAERTFKLQKQLFEKGVVAEDDLKTARFDHDRARKKLEAAKKRLQLVKKGSLGKSYSATEVRATIPGVVLSIPVKVGGFVIETNTYNEGSTIMSIADMNDMLFEGQVGELEAGKLEEDMELLLYVGALEDVAFNATLEFVSPEGEKEDGVVSFEIRARVSQSPERFIRAGYSANAHIILKRADSVLAVKERILNFDKNDKPYLILENGKQGGERKYVELGVSDGINIEVSGIGQEEKIRAIDKTEK